MKTKEQLEAELRPIQQALADLRDKETLAASKALVGKCFKYHNNYSCPEKPIDYWWLYIKVVRVGDYWPVTFEFQTDKHGHITIKTNDCCVITGKDGYVPITSREFDAAWAKVQKKIAGTKP